MAEEKKYLGTAAVERLIANTRTEIEAAKNAANDYSDSLADNYDAAGTAQTKVNELANGQVKTNKEAIGIVANLKTTAKGDLVSAVNEVLETAETKVNNLTNGAVKTNTEHIGTMDDLETTAKSDLVKAINEVRNAVSVGGTAAAISMKEETTGLGEGILKAYIIKQGDNTVGTINIPKDMVVQSGEVVTNPAGQAAGTYIKLTLANATNDIIYVNVGNLVDIYKAKASAAQVQLAIDSATREISAAIVAGSIGATELAANAVVTAKIADGNVTKAKLATAVQTELDKAHEHSNKTKLDTYDKTQTELLTAAKTEAEGLVSGKADKATTLDGYGITDAYTIEQVDDDIETAKQEAIDHAKGLNTAMDTRVKALEAIDHDHTNKAKLDTYDKTQAELLAAAKSEAEGHASGLNTAMDIRVKALEDKNSPTWDQYRNALGDIDGALENHTNRLDALESVTYTEITAAEIDAMFEA